MPLGPCSSAIQRHAGESVLRMAATEEGAQDGAGGWRRCIIRKMPCTSKEGGVPLTTRVNKLWLLLLLLFLLLLLVNGFIAIVVHLAVHGQDVQLLESITPTHSKHREKRMEATESLAPLRCIFLFLNVTTINVRHSTSTNN